MIRSDKQASGLRAILLQTKAGQASLGEAVHWVLRVGAAGCSSVILLYPMRAVLPWVVLWTVWTALLRPLTGEGVWEFIERAGNYGVPFALLYLAGWPRRLRWFALAAPLLDSAKALRLAWVLRVTVFCLLLGHGGFGAFMQKHTWTHYLATLGISPDHVRTLSLVPIIGWFEIALALLVLVAPSAELVLFVFAWKVFTESLHPFSGEPLWEFIERFGSYAAPLALFLILLARRSDPKDPKHLRTAHCDLQQGSGNQ